MKHAETFGFSPNASGIDNAEALRRAIQNGGTVSVDEPGTYDVEGTILLPDDVALFFGAGVYLRRVDGAKAGALFLNEGALERRVNRHIRIEGLRLLCNGARNNKRLIPGLGGQLSFFYVQDVILRDIECLDLTGFFVHVCTFEDLLIENIRIEGDKDGIHLGRGRRFAIRHGVFRTFDDPIALNAHDYATSNPQLGWIEDGVIEDCYDLDDATTTGFFCRILAGSWLDWRAGMEVQHSDTVVSNGRLYRVLMKPDAAVYTTRTAPTHAKGIAELDGISWVMVQEEALYNCGCRNVVFRDIFLQKKRPIGFSIHFDCDVWSRSYYPGSIPPVQENLLFDHIVTDAPVDVLISTHTPVDAVHVANSTIAGVAVELKHDHAETAPFKRTRVLLSGNTFLDEGVHTLIRCSGRRPASLKVQGSLVLHDSFQPGLAGDVEVIASDLHLTKEG